MQNLIPELKQAFRDALMGSYADRKACIDNVFTPDATFWHIAHVAKGKEDIWGVYQLWACNNLHLNIDFLRILPDPQERFVIVDLIEHCHVWWQPLFTLQGGPKVLLHTVLELERGPDGKLRICYQYDHTMWLESLLYFNLPRAVGDFFIDYYRPSMGRVYSTLGNWIYDVLHSTVVKSGGHVNANIGLHEDKFEKDLERVLQLGFQGTFDERRKLAKAMYTPDAEFWHPLAICKGPKQIAGFYQLWCTFNRKVEAKIVRIVPAKDRSIVVLDLEQHFTPFFWPPFLPSPQIWLYVILHLVDSPNGGKQVSRHEDHAFWVESMVFSKLNLVGWLHDNYVRPINGKLFGIFGRTVHDGLAWWRARDKKGGARQRQKNARKQL